MFKERLFAFTLDWFFTVRFYICEARHWQWEPWHGVPLSSERHQQLLLLWAPQTGEKTLQPLCSHGCVATDRQICPNLLFRFPPVFQSSKCSSEDFHFWEDGNQWTKVCSWWNIFLNNLLAFIQEEIWSDISKCLRRFFKNIFSLPKSLLPVHFMGEKNPYSY